MNPFKQDKKNPDMEIYTIFDSKSNSYREPTHAKNQFVLTRELENLFKNPQHKDNLLVINAEDFSLFKIGEYDLKTGQITSINPQHIINLHELRALIQ